MATTRSKPQMAKRIRQSVLNETNNVNAEKEIAANQAMVAVIANIAVSLDGIEAKTLDPEKSNSIVKNLEDIFIDILDSMEKIPKTLVGLEKQNSTVMKSVISAILKLEKELEHTDDAKEKQKLIEAIKKLKEVGQNAFDKSSESRPSRGPTTVGEAIAAKFGITSESKAAAGGSAFKAFTTRFKNDARRLVGISPPDENAPKSFDDVLLDERRQIEHTNTVQSALGDERRGVGSTHARGERVTAARMADDESGSHTELFAGANSGSDIADPLVNAVVNIDKTTTKILAAIENKSPGGLGFGLPFLPPTKFGKGAAGGAAKVAGKGVNSVGRWSRIKNLFTPTPASSGAIRFPARGLQGQGLPTLAQDLARMNAPAAAVKAATGAVPGATAAVEAAASTGLRASTGRALSVVGRFARPLGQLATPVIATYETFVAAKNVRAASAAEAAGEITHKQANTMKGEAVGGAAGGVGGMMAGSALGLKGGAALGGAIGSAFFGVGAVPGAAIGGLIGSLVGGGIGFYGGKKIGSATVGGAAGALTSETPPPTIAEIGAPNEPTMSISDSPNAVGGDTSQINNNTTNNINNGTSGGQSSGGAAISLRDVHNSYMRFQEKRMARVM